MKNHPQDKLLSSDDKLELDSLLSKRKSTSGLDGSGEYQRITARIRYLRYGPSSIYAWREANADRIKYERSCGIAYVNPKRTTELTPEQRTKRNEACYRSDAKNPQRKIRRNIERTILLSYNAIKAGRPFNTPPRRSEALWGCDAAAFKRHIKDQLIRLGFTWNDWNVRWTMDHVVPVRSFDLPREQYACWHYTNLRPLEKGKNHRAQRN